MLLVFLVGSCCVALGSRGSHRTPHAQASRSSSTSQCTDVFLQTAYLVEERPGDGPAFLIVLRNNRSTPIVIAEPAPLSIHWYARAGGAWLWRASSGAGGALVNALQIHGPVFTTPSPTLQETEVAPHQSLTWTVSLRTKSSLAYRPGCQHCAFDHQEDYRAILAYAVRPASGQASTNWLQCGLRSNPVSMPPLEDSLSPHNFQPEPGSLPK